MKYKAGDEVFIRAEITDICPSSERPYFIAPDKYSVNWVSEDKIIPMDKTYVDGLNDAWQLAKKIALSSKDGGYSSEELIKIFSGFVYTPCDIIKSFTYEEALAKIEAYEKEKKFCVGDEIVNSMGETFIILALADGEVYGYSNDGKYEDFPVQRIECHIESGRAEKTGKHIDIESLLRQIGE